MILTKLLNDYMKKVENAVIKAPSEIKLNIKEAKGRCFKTYTLQML